jgi:hypothetical protein
MPRSPAPAAAILLFAVACRPPTPSTHRAETPHAAVATPQEVPDTTPPADVSHGEAPIGGAKAEAAPRLARLEPAEASKVHRIRLEMKHAAVAIAPGVTSRGRSAAPCRGPRCMCARATPWTLP